MANWIVAALVGAMLLASNAAGNAQELAQIEKKNCNGVVFNVNDPNSVALHANWCGTSGATKTIAANGGVCHRYAGSYGPIHQNEIFRLAVIDAKKWEYLDAVAKIAACQCHNDAALKMTYNQPRELVCWLRTQKY
jgi:hypothetical protein